MKFSIKLASTTGILLALAACGGSSSSTPAEQSPDEEVVGRTNGAEALLFGTTSTTQSGNGLVFAAEGLEIDPEASLPAATVRLVRFVSDNVTGETSLVISDEVVTIANFDNDPIIKLEDSNNGELLAIIRLKTYTYMFALHIWQGRFLTIE